LTAFATKLFANLWRAAVKSWRDLKDVCLVLCTGLQGVSGMQPERYLVLGV